MEKPARILLQEWFDREGRKKGWLADQLKIDRASLSQWMSGARKPHPARREKVEQITGVPADAWDDQSRETAA